MADEILGQAPVLAEDKEKIIQKLTEEKKILEDKNKRLASILEITAKNVSKLEQQSKESSTEEGGDVVSQVVSIKKEIGSLERKIEKSKSLQSSEQLSAVLAEIKSRFEKLDEKMNGLDKLMSLEKKLVEIEDSITLRRRGGNNLFGGLGALGGGVPTRDSGKEGEETNYNAEEDFGKLDEINLKLDAITKRLDGIPAAGEKHFFSGGLKKILPSFSDKNSNKEEIEQIKQNVDETHSKSADVSGITFRKIDPAQARKDAENEVAMQLSDIPKISEAVEGIKFKVHAPTHSLDFKKVPDDIRKGHVVLLNVKALKDESMDELRHFIERLKRVSDGISAKIMGIGEHHIIVLPQKIEVHPEQNKSQNEQ